jgi:hypothetical protein
VFYNSASELATLTNTFSVNGTATDPTTISLTITSPTGVVNTYTFAAAEITKSATGVYTKDIACTEADDWTYLWTGTGAASDVVAGKWTVFETTLGKLYCSVESLKSRLDETSTRWDHELHSACFTASRWLDSYCDRYFWRTASSEVRTFVPEHRQHLVLPAFNDLVSTTTLKSDDSGDGTFETTWATTDYQLHPLNPSAGPEQRPYTEIRAIGSYSFPLSYGTSVRSDSVQITGAFGWPSVPWGIREAAKILAADTYKGKDLSFETGGEGEFAIRAGDMRRVRMYADRYRRYGMYIA